jgi:adenine-specific DNA-methyltransferase
VFLYTITGGPDKYQVKYLLICVVGLISKDEWGNPVINPDFNPSLLTEAMCKLEGFHYSPSDETYWIHGSSTESDYIYVCTQFMTREMLTRISDDVGPERSLLICCTAFKCNPADFPNLTIKKIPKAVLQKCEWGKDDYSLAVNNLPPAPIEPDFDDEKAESESISSKATGKKQSTILDLEQGGKK